jgi:hypothetical protein
MMCLWVSYKKKKGEKVGSGVGSGSFRQRSGSGSASKLDTGSV